MKLDPINRALVATLFVLAALLLVRLGQQALTPSPGFELGVEPDAVVSFSITEQDGFLRVARAGDGWRVVDPPEAAAPADAAAVARLLEGWRHFETSYMAVSEATPRGLHSIGIEPNEVVKLRLEGANEAKLLSVEIGGELPSGERYVRRESDRAVYVGRVEAGDLLFTGAGRWVDRAALPAVASQVLRFGILNQHGEQTFERRDGRWVRTSTGQPVQQRALTHLLLSALELGRARRLLTGDAAAAGEAGRTPRISLWWEMDGSSRQVAHLCGDAPGGDLVYLDRETPSLFVVRAEELVRFDIGPEALDVSPSP